MPRLKSFLDAIKSECPPGVWAQGLTLSKSSAMNLIQETAEEIKIQFKVPEKIQALTLTLWPNDDDAHCSCGKDLPCVHIVAVANAFARGDLKKETRPTGKRLHYQIFVTGDLGADVPALSKTLFIERQITNGRLTASDLSSALGQSFAGRLIDLISRGDIVSTPEDMGLDGLFQRHAKIPLSHLSPSHYSLLSQVPISFESQSLTVRSSPHPTLLRLSYNNRILNCFWGGPIESPEHLQITDILNHCELRPPSRAPKTIQAIKNPEDIYRFLHETLPLLSQEVTVLWDSPEPRFIHETPQVALIVEPLNQDCCAITPRLEITSADTDPSACVLPRPELRAELSRRLRQEFSLVFDQPVQLKWNELTPTLKKLESLGEKQFKTQLSAAALRALSPIPVQLSLETSPTEGPVLSVTTPSQNLGEPRSWKPVDLSQGLFATKTGQWVKTRVQNPEIFERLQSLLNQPKRTPPEMVLLRQFAHQSGLLTSPDFFSEIPFDPVPEHWVKAELRPYQKQGIEFISSHRKVGTGALLADDMGLGKTLQTLATLRGNSLIVAPKSLLENWLNESLKFRPDLKPVLLLGQESFFSAPTPRLGPDEIGITSYGLIRSRSDFFCRLDLEALVLDEAHTLRNQNTLIFDAIARIRTRFHLALTGTPIQNTSKDLFHLFSLINPELFSDFDDFLSRPKDTEPFFLRRTKAQVLTDLPEKTWLQHDVELSDEERETYQALLKMDLAKEIESDSGRGLSLFEMLLRARQACVCLQQIPGFENLPAPHTKLIAAKNLIVDLICSGHRILVYSQWTKVLDRFGALLTEEAMPFVRLDGTTQNRGEIVSQFQAGNTPIFLLSLHAGGVGLNLTAADHVVFLDPWWNPAVEAQAEDRAHRIGQKNPVMIHRFISKNTLEASVQELHRLKKEDAARFLG